MAGMAGMRRWPTRDKLRGEREREHARCAVVPRRRRAHGGAS
jgi:hypothetical protein